MLVNLSDLMRIAEERQIAIGAFNGPTLESARAALEAAEALHMPLILQHAPAHDKYISLELAGKIMLMLAKDAARFAKETGVDALAISFGTVHGVYKAKPKLNFDIIRRHARGCDAHPARIRG